MNISEDRIQAFLDKKGWKPVADDSQWIRCISELTAILGKEFHYRVKTVTQQEDSLRRFCTRFPDQIPKPYRFIDWIDFGAYLPEEGKEIKEIKKVVVSNGIIFELISDKFWVNDEQKYGSRIRIRGYKNKPAQPGSPYNSGQSLRD